MTLDRVAPTVAIELTSPSPTGDTNVSVNLIGADDGGTGIASWVLADYTSVQASPLAPSSGWNGSSTPPTNYSIVSNPTRPANIYIYAWAKDKAGNVCTTPPYITIDLRKAATATLSGSTTRVGHESIILTFDDAMSLGNLTIGGTIGSSAVASMPDAYTLRLLPAPLWPEGSASLTISGTSDAGINMNPYSASFTIQHRIYVGTTGSDSNIGSTTAPKLKIQSAIDKATMYYRLKTSWSAIAYAVDTVVKTSGNCIYRCVAYDGSIPIGDAISGSEPTGTGNAIVSGPNTWCYLCIYSTSYAVDILVSEGEYSVDYHTSGAPVAAMIADVSLYGGYSTDFESRSTTTYETTLSDTSTEGSGSYNATNRAVQFVPTVGNPFDASTVLDGFTIKAGRCTTTDSWSAAVFCDASNETCSPVISNCILNGGAVETTATNSAGIVNIKAAAPTIKTCKIDGGKGGYGDYGIYNFGSSPLVENNEILGGTHGDDSTFGLTCGIYNAYDSDSTTASSPLILRNTIRAGDCATANRAYGIYCGNANASKIYNNTISGGTTNSSGGAVTLSTYGIWIQNASPDIRNNTIDGGYDSDWSSKNPACIYLYMGAGTPPTIENNLLFFRGMMSGYGVYEYSAATPTSFKNNDIFDCSKGLYYDYDTSTNITNIANVNLLTNSSGNINTVQSTSIKVLSIQAATWDEQKSGAWTLNASLAPTDVKTGALDRTGLADFPINASGKPTDRTGTTERTGSAGTGWSMGAYELN